MAGQSAINSKQPYSLETTAGRSIKERRTKEGKKPGSLFTSFFLSGQEPVRLVYISWLLSRFTGRGKYFRRPTDSSGTHAHTIYFTVYLINFNRCKLGDTYLNVQASTSTYTCWPLFIKSASVGCVMESVTAFGVLLMMVMAIEEVATANRHFQVKDGARYLEETLLL